MSDAIREFIRKDPIRKALQTVRGASIIAIETTARGAIDPVEEAYDQGRREVEQARREGRLAALADLRGQSIGNNEPFFESLTDNEYTILRALRDAHPRRVFMSDLSAATAITRKTCGQVTSHLANRGLADYDSGKREGATITDEGQNLLAEDAR